MGHALRITVADGYMVHAVRPYEAINTIESRAGREISTRAGVYITTR